jgi:hypothetical protein
MGKKGYTEERKIVSRLIYMVLTDTLTVREAILKFPQDVNDSTVKTAYHALVHRESDEDFRRENLDYKDEQDDYLEFIAQILQTGDALPKNIIESYNKYYKDANMPHSESMKGLIKSLCKFLNV